MKILVLTAFYPVPGGTHERMFVHVRNKYYKEQGIDVTVLNFDAQKDYIIDNIPVITLDTYNKSKAHYDIAVSHSANLRNHYRFLKKNQNSFPHLVFFFHGHEMLYLTKDYPKPYPYDKSGRWYRRTAQYLYDKLKISLWKNYYKELASKSEFVFVSNWLFDRFNKNTGLTEDDLDNHCHIINNSVGKVFEEKDYNHFCKKRYDFITIRSNIDGSKYCVDLVTSLARKYPGKKFLLIGKGKFFEYNNLPDNLEWIPETFSQEELIPYINDSKCALMLTREDTQGVMTCELATYGIPVITSDIPVCHEFFDDIDIVLLVKNKVDDIEFNENIEDMLGGSIQESSWPLPEIQRILCGKYNSFRSRVAERNYEFIKFFITIEFFIDVSIDAFMKERRCNNE